MFENFEADLLYIFLALVISKIIEVILNNIARSLKKDIKYNKMALGVISRKDFSSFESQSRIKSKILYYIANSKQIPRGFIPYSWVFDDEAFSKLDEFIDWCDRYLCSQGLCGAKVISKRTYLPEQKDDLDSRGTFAILSYENKLTSKKTYAACILLKRKDIISQEDVWPQLGRPDIQRIVGLMVRDKVDNAIIITTGDYSKLALEYADSMPEPYSVKLIGGDSLAALHRQMVNL